LQKWPVRPRVRVFGSRATGTVEFGSIMPKFSPKQKNLIH